jgi:hypothetical protein
MDSSFSSSSSSIFGSFPVGVAFTVGIDEDADRHSVWIASLDDGHGPGDGFVLARVRQATLPLILTAPHGGRHDFNNQRMVLGTERVSSAGGPRMITLSDLHTLELIQVKYALPSILRPCAVMRVTGTTIHEHLASCFINRR